MDIDSEREDDDMSVENGPTENSQDEEDMEQINDEDRHSPSPARSRSGSPASHHSSPRSGDDDNNSEGGSPPGSPAGSPPRSPAGSGSPPQSPVGSPQDSNDGSHHSQEEDGEREHDDMVNQSYPPDEIGPDSPNDTGQMSQEEEEDASAVADTQLEGEEESAANGSPAADAPGSPDGPQSPASQPHSREASPAASDRSRSRSRSGSPASHHSAPASPAGSHHSRSRSRSRSASPAHSDARSRSRSRSGSPRGSRSRSGSPRGSRSRSGSPRGSRSRSRSGSPKSPIVSPVGSPARSGSGSPRHSRSRSRSGSRSGSGSRSRSRSGSPHSPPVSPVGSGGRRSRSGSRSRSGTPRSRSGSRSVSRSRSRSGSRARSRSGSGSRSRSRSRSGTPRSRSRSRSRSGSRASSVGSVGHAEMGSGDERPRKKKRAIEDSDDEGGGAASGEEGDKEKDELIADIFGSSDEEEEFRGFDASEISKKDKKKRTAMKSDDEGEDGVSGQLDIEGMPPADSDDENMDALRKGETEGGSFVSDFDMMLAKRKEEQSKQRRKRKDVDLINDNDDLIADLIVKMKEAANLDRELNQKKQVAVQKVKMLPYVLNQLKKADLHGIFLESGILSAMTEWLAPLPDKSLPHLNIRESFLKILSQFPSIHSDMIKSSGIGKAIMYLYKHPRETKLNKIASGKLINEWSRPIFNLTSNYKMLSKEEREQRDYEQIPKRRRTSAEGAQTPKRDIDNALSGEKKALRPGDPGWVYRARVPLPSHKDYVVRPKTNSDYQPPSTTKSGAKKKIDRYERHKRSFLEKKRLSKTQKAVTISIEGRNMSL